MGPLPANAKKYGYLSKDEKISFILAGEISFIIAGEISFIIAATMHLLFFGKYNHRYVLCCNSVYNAILLGLQNAHLFYQGQVWASELL